MFWISRSADLEHSKQGLGEVIKRAPLGHSLIKVELAPKELHAEQGENDDEEEEQQQQGGDRLHGVEQGCHQVTKRCPVTVEKQI